MVTYIHNGIYATVKKKDENLKIGGSRVKQNKWEEKGKNTRLSLSSLIHKK